MKRYYGGEPVQEGVYLNLSTLEFALVQDKAPVLPGSRNRRYVRAPALLTVVAGPVAGLALVLFVPFAGLVGMAAFVAYRLMKGVQWLGGRVFRTTPADW